MEGEAALVAHDFATRRPDDTRTRKTTTSMLPQTRLMQQGEPPGPCKQGGVRIRAHSCLGTAFQLKSHCRGTGDAQAIRGGRAIVERRATNRRGDGHELGIGLGDDTGRPCGPAHRRVEHNTVVRVLQVPAGVSRATFPKHMLTLMAGSGVGHWRGTHQQWVKMTCLRTRRM